MSVFEGFSLSPLQHHLWRVRARDPLGHWFASARVRVRGSFDPTNDPAKLREALAAVVERAEILRTAYPLLPGTHSPVQSILEARPPKLVERRLDPRQDQSDALEAFERELAGRLEPSSGDVLSAGLASAGADDQGDHVLLLVQPSIASDESSLWNLVRRLAGALRGEEALGDEEAPQFADIAQWLHENFESTEARAGFEHWRHALLPPLDELRLPLAFDRGEARGFAPAEHVHPLTEAEVAAIERASARIGTSPAATLLAAWQVLLARISERDEFLLALRSPGRSIEGLEGALGPFARFLPLRVRIDADERFASLVERAERSRLEAESWHELFDLERVGGAIDTSFACGFAYLPPHAAELARGLVFELERRFAVSEPFQLLCAFDAAARERSFSLAYDPRFFGAQDVAVLAEEYAALVAHACAELDAPAGSLSLLSDRMRGRVLGEFARAKPPREVTRPIHVDVAETARRAPLDAAVAAEGRSLTYGELDANSNRLARHLQTLGVGPGTCVGIYLDRSVEMMTAILGVHKAGGAYVPLPPGYPAERIAFMLEDSQAPVLLTRSREARSLQPYDGRMIRLDADSSAIERSSATALALAEQSALDAPAYVIYTSGSTGKPKGVVVTHANLAHSTQARLEYYRKKPERYLLLSSFAFDSSAAGIFWTLAQGGQLVMPEEGFEQEIPSIAKLVREHRATHLLALPSLWNVLLDTAQPGDLASLKTVIVAGEACLAELVRRHFDALAGCELHNEYGPTEGTVWSTVYDCSTPFERMQVPIGRPIPGAEVYVVDPAGELAPIGMAGELWIGGPGVAAGYFARPELTAERFVPDPFRRGGARLYRTGDLARFLPDKNVEFLGRIDQQVKIRGYRIELPEIEAALLAHRGVREAVVLAREDEPGDKRLVAYVTPTDSAAERNGELAPSELRSFLSGPLPEYMVPAHFVCLPDLPLLPNGKVDRKRLPAPDQDRSSVRAPYVAPRNPLEKVLAAIWSDVLKTQEVGVEDDFFELGGHSILATQLFARMVDTLQVKIPLRAIFDQRTIAGLAQKILSDSKDCARVERAAEIVLSVLEMTEEEAAQALERK